MYSIKWTDIVDDALYRKEKEEYIRFATLLCGR